MKQVFTTYENGNASIEAFTGKPSRGPKFHIRTRLGAACIVLYADMAELIDLRNKLTELIQDSYTGPEYNTKPL